VGGAALPVVGSEGLVPLGEGSAAPLICLQLDLARAIYPALSMWGFNPVRLSVSRWLLMQRSSPNF
jgi:hypothetical protein